MILALLLVSQLSVAANAGAEVSAPDAGAPVEFTSMVGHLESDPIDPVVEAKCAATELAACHQRGIRLLREGGGEAPLREAIGLLRASCKHGLKESCQDLERGATLPKPIVSAMPDYTRSALEHSVAGTVTVKCRLPVDGSPRDCQVLRSVPDLNRAVLSALGSARYEPATVAGVPVEVTYVWDFRFWMPGRSETPALTWKPVLYQRLLDRCAGEAARRCAEDARLLAGKREQPGDADRAARLFSAACEQGYRPACEPLQKQFSGPQRLDQLLPDTAIPPEEEAARGEFVCWITVTGEVQRCRVTKSTILDALC